MALFYKLASQVPFKSRDLYTSGHGEMFEGLNEELVKSTCIEVIDSVNKISDNKH